MTRVFDEDLSAGFGTRAIHAGQRPEPLAGAIMTPIYLTSTYVQEALGEHKGYEYARGKNPTREAFERNVAALEGGRHGFAFASGMGCLDSIMKLFRSGETCFLSISANSRNSSSWRFVRCRGVSTMTCTSKSPRRPPRRPGIPLPGICTTSPA